MNSKKCLVSVCIPARNAENYIRYTLANLVQNDFDPEQLEILICNHGSTDQTSAIVRSYQQRYNQIRMLEIPFDKPNRPRVRNTLLKNARGEILIFMDQDILTCRQFIRAHVAIHHNFKKALVTGYTYGKNSMNQSQFCGGADLAKLDLNDITNNYQFLRAQDELKDAREMLGYVGEHKDSYTDLTNTIAPFKAFWLCNFSFLKSELEKIGGFDEFYKGWGLDDDDTAYGLELAGNRMIFSNKAWAYHMYHPVQVNDNVTSWRKNCEHCFHKYQTRELELYWMYKGHIKSGVEEIELDMSLMPSAQEYKDLIRQVAAYNGSSAAKRLGIFMRDEESADALKLTECFIPYVAASTSPYHRNNCRFWSLLGAHTCFQNNEMDETIVIADLVMYLEDSLLKTLMIEVARISKKVIIYFGKFTTVTETKYLLDLFMVILNHIKFESVDFVSI